MVKFDNEKCVGCGKCVSECPFGIISVRNGKAGNHNIDCMKCGHCVAACPCNAVYIEDYDMNEVLDLNRKFSINPDDYLYMIKTRRSIRNYKNNTVEIEKLEKIIEAGRYTATAKNTQSNQFVVIQNDLEEFKEMFWTSLENIFEDSEKSKNIPKEIRMFLKNKRKNPDNDFIFRNAPAVIFVANDKPVDVGLACQNMENMAVLQGLGVLYNGYLARLTDAMTNLKNYIGIENEKQIFLTMLVGYPDVKYFRTTPKKKADVIWK